MLPTPANMQKHWCDNSKATTEAASLEFCYYSIKLVVFTDVSVSIPRLCKGLSTVGTGVWPLACVYPHVNVQFVFANKAFVAAGACVRFIPRVIALVHLQLSHATISPVALGTLVAGPHLHVLSAVQPQPAG